MTWDKYQLPLNWRLISGGPKLIATVSGAWLSLAQHGEDIPGNQNWNRRSRTFHSAMSQAAQRLDPRRQQRDSRHPRSTARLRALTNEAADHQEGTSPYGRQRVPGRPRRPCHQRAIHSSLDRSPADNHGQHHHGYDLLSSSPPQVPNLPGPALQAGSRMAETVIGLVVPGRSGPSSRPPDRRR
jgi:hypothetical protein